MPVKNRSFFIFSLFRFLENFTPMGGNISIGYNPTSNKRLLIQILVGGGRMGVSAAKMDGETLPVPWDVTLPNMIALTGQRTVRQTQAHILFEVCAAK